MFAIFRKELALFFSSVIGYISVSVFLIFNGVFCFGFQNNILDAGYASLSQLFDNAPLILLFLIPALTMRMFSEELKNGTIELLSTRPLSGLQIIFGKYLAAFTLFLICLLPTILYYLTVYLLAVPQGNLDNGAIMGSYFGLVMLGATFIAIGLFASSLSSNQTVAFVIGISMCFFFYLCFDYISKLPGIFGKFDYYVQQFGINSHYQAVSYGVIDTRDVVYFLSLIGLFILATKTSLDSRKW